MPLIRAPRYFQVERTLVRKIGVDTIAQLLTFATQHQSTHLARGCELWMLDHFRDVIRTSPQALADLPALWLIDMIEDDRLWVADDTERYACAAAILATHDPGPPPAKKRRLDDERCVGDVVRRGVLAQCAFRGIVDWYFRAEVENYLLQLKEVPPVLLLERARTWLSGTGPIWGHASHKWLRFSFRLGFRMLNSRDAVITRVIPPAAATPWSFVAVDRARDLAVEPWQMVKYVDRSNVRILLENGVTCVMSVVESGCNSIDLRTRFVVDPWWVSVPSIACGLVLHRRDGGQSACFDSGVPALCMVSWFSAKALHASM